MIYGTVFSKNVIFYVFIIFEMILDLSLYEMYDKYF